ncbi:adenylate cyclase [Rhodopseudomonas julia]|uniref:Adenylate cyclase n=1 Tax=Rhodopseudomonas julia TaxID=200617 RepID=A0ABU0C7U5_9BRAD|nr:CYTH domain-containing protein [Rhodopseudomonas julia]MDQ0326592.1 adenylate cyclase [Rhodopseudomonas julia]
MALEIERKFLLASDDWRKSVNETRHIRQGYLCNDERASLRVRIVDDEKAYLTIKSGKAAISRDEYEYAIPLEDGEELIAKCAGRLIEKTRHIIRHGHLAWEIDVFEDRNAGLVVAEIELDHPDQEFEHPEWLGEEVTGDGRYTNASLSQHPYHDWT